MASVLTTLEAVNSILRMLGRRPVSSLDPANLAPDAAFALQEIETVNRQVQDQGWFFNIERAVQLPKNVSDRVPVTDDVARVETPRRGPWGTTSFWFNTEFIIRTHPTDGRCLWDKSAQARDEDPFDLSRFAEVRVDLVRLLDFDETPDSFRHYVMVRAGRNVQARILGDPALYRFSMDDEARALQVLAREELGTSQANARNTDVARNILRRRY